MTHLGLIFLSRGMTVGIFTGTVSDKSYYKATEPRTALFDACLSQES